MTKNKSEKMKVPGACSETEPVVAHSIPGFRTFWFNKDGQDTMGCEVVRGDWSAFGWLRMFEYSFEQVMDWYGL